MRSDHQILCAILLWIGFLGTGCEDSIDANFDGSAHYGTSRLNPNLAPYHGNPPSPDGFFSNGDELDENGDVEAAGDEVVSELLVGGMTGPVSNLLHSSACLWTHLGDSPEISYELIVHNVTTDAESFPEITFCAGELSEPDSREAITNGPVVLPGPHPFETLLRQHRGASVAALPSILRPCDAPFDANGDGSDDDDGELAILNCGSPGVGCGLFDWENAPADDYPMSAATAIGTRSTLPMCSIRSQTPPLDIDTTLVLSYLPVENGGTEVEYDSDGDGQAETHVVEQSVEASVSDRVLEPRLRVVAPAPAGEAFTLGRRLTLAGTSGEHVGDQTTHTQFFQWTVPFDSDGNWHENFSPTLRIDRLRVFRLIETDGEFVREYVKPRRVEVFHAETGVLPGRRLKGCNIDAPEGAEGDDWIRECAGERGFSDYTPTYAHATPSTRLEWQVEFQRKYRGTCADDIANCDELLSDRWIAEDEEPIFIEFALTSGAFATMGRALEVESANGGAFGNVRVDEGALRENAFELVARDPIAVSVDQVWIEGPDAGSFAFEFADGQEAPFLMGPEERAPITLSWMGGAWGDHEARLHVTGMGDLTGPFSRTIDLSAYADTWSFYALPANFSLERGLVGYPSHPYFVKTLLLHNLGGVPMARGPITIAGNDAAAFSVVRSQPGAPSMTGDPYEPAVNGEWPAASNTIAGGEVEWLFVVYHPTDTYRPPLMEPDRAEIQIEIGPHVEVIPLTGRCEGFCSFAPPQAHVPTSGATTLVPMDALPPELWFPPGN